MIMGDMNKLSEVFQNIVMNAIQIMNGKGSITVNFSTFNNTNSLFQKLALKPGKYIQIEIRDSGPGISESIMPRIFEQYFTTKENGHGLGLSISYNVIKKHDGIITVESELGKGASFFIFLPLI